MIIHSHRGEPYAILLNPDRVLKKADKVEVNHVYKPTFFNLSYFLHYLKNHPKVVRNGESVQVFL